MRRSRPFVAPGTCSVLTRLFRTESFRLTAVFAALIVGVMLALMALIYATTYQAFRAQLWNSIAHDLASIESGYRSEGISEVKEIIQQRLFRSGGTDYFVLETVSGTKIAGNLPPMPPRIGERRLAMPQPSFGNDGEDHELLGRGRLLSQDLYVFVGRDLYVANAAEESVLHTFGWVLAATLGVALAGGMLLSRSFLGRMDAITKTCRAIMAGHLSDRIPDRGSRDEFDQLTRTINAMLDRIVELMDSIQQISSDIAHDLRTPLTRLRHHLESVHNEGSDIQAYRQAVERAIVESETLLAIFSGLLRIGQIESGAAGIVLERVDLSTLLGELAEIYGPVAEDRGHRLVVGIERDQFVPGDKALLKQVFVNLIENALAHSSPGSMIEIGLAPSGDQILAVIGDNGPGIPADEHENVFRRFYRLEQSRSSPGSGLGLSLVGAILKAHGAKISLSDNHPGLRATVTFKNIPSSIRSAFA